MRAIERLVFVVVLLVCVYVCMCMYVCVCMYVYVCMCMYVCVHRAPVYLQSSVCFFFPNDNGNIYDVTTSDLDSRSPRYK